MTPRCSRLEHLKHVDLKDWNSFGISEIAEDCWQLNDSTEVPALLELLATKLGDNATTVSVPGPQQTLPLLIGGGSNLLIVGPVHRPIVRFEFMHMSIVEQNADHAIVQAQAGANWHEFVLWCLRQDLYGLENLSLIPGTVGASPVQNIGAYGVEMKDYFHSLDAYDISAAQVGAPILPRVMSPQDCQFAYRDSVFKRNPNLWITAVRFKLNKMPTLKLDYGDLRHWLTEQSIAHPSPRDVSNAVIAIRSGKLPDPKKIGNAGSFFKNPVINMSQLETLLADFSKLPHYPGVKPDERKVSAAWLIEQCGFKGLRDGDAGVHASHALVLVNHGLASGQSVLALAQKIQKTVKSRFGIQLEPEPMII